MSRSQTHFTNIHPFTHSDCWHATQLVTAWITLHEGPGGESHTGNLILCHIKCQGRSFNFTVITTETAGGDAQGAHCGGGGGGRMKAGGEQAVKGGGGGGSIRGTRGIPTGQKVIFHIPVYI